MPRPGLRAEENGEEWATPARTAVSTRFPKPGFTKMEKFNAEAWRARPYWVE